MEKQRKIRKFKFFNRLLKSVCALFLLWAGIMPAESQRLTNSVVRNLQIQPQKEINFTGTECIFSVLVPYVKSADIRTEIPALPSGVNFISLRRSEYYGDDGGTIIELWLSFDRKGSYKLPPLRLRVNGKAYSIPFAPVSVSENPANILPRIVVEFDNGLRLDQGEKKGLSGPLFQADAGGTVRFTVFIQYAVQIIHFDWAIPKNAILTEIERYDITKGLPRGSEFSEDLFPIASFDWQPLVPGNTPLPDLRIVSTAYNGSRVEIAMPPAFISVNRSAPGKNTVSDNENYFVYAFTQTETASKETAKKVISPSDCEKIAALRSAERRSILFDSARKERRSFEKSLGITDSYDEPSVLILHIFIAFAVIFLVIIIIACIFRRFPIAFCFSACFAAAAVSLVIYSVRLSDEYAVFKGGSLSTVPEKNAEAVSGIESGVRVKVMHKADDWIYVQAGSMRGWTFEKNVIFIK